MTVTPTWFERDLPILSSIVAYFEEHGGGLLPQVSDLAEITGMDPKEVFRACLALKDDYVDLRLVMSGGDPNPHCVEGITSAARRAVGQWPSADTWADQIVRGLQAAADAEPDESRKSRLRAAADAMGGFGRDVLVGVISGGITKASGFG